MEGDDAVERKDHWQPLTEPKIVQIDDDETDGACCQWMPICRRPCEFGPAHFDEAMVNLMRNPNLLSSWLFRADILLDHVGVPASGDMSAIPNRPRLPLMKGFRWERMVVRRLIPRNTRRDSPMLQTCSFYAGDDDDGCIGVGESAASCRRSLVLYLPHVTAESDVPFYHPPVRGVGFLHEWRPRRSQEGDDGDASGQGTISIHYLPFDDFAGPPSERLVRTAMSILAVTHKLGQGGLRGYVKRVHHDVLVPQSAFQDRYSSLRDKHARGLVHGWMEVTDPMKHVFEDLCIAAFLIELWAGMYPGAPGASSFPGFVDIGCGNGLLVSILNKEGFRGWGFDARSRKSWTIFNGELEDGKEFLQQLVLLPALVDEAEGGEPLPEAPETNIHDGTFPSGTFIISNHADELTPWTPILAAASGCPFVAIPCCSHNLTGARFRAPPPLDKSKPKTAYSSLVAWVAEIAADSGWEPETEVLRIPSTRNIAIVGRRTKPGLGCDVDLRRVVEKYGGAGNYRQNALNLIKEPASHVPDGSQDMGTVHNSDH